MTLDLSSRFDRLDAYIAEDRILRRKWFDTDENGRERACLLGALAPEVGVGEVSRCPASVIPAWLAYLTPEIDDRVSDSAWSGVVREYARVVHLGATTLDDAGWRRVLARFILAVLAEAPSEKGEAMAALWRSVLAGNEPSSAAAAAAAWTAAWEAQAAAEDARAEAEEARAARAEAAAWAWAAAAAWDRMAAALFAAIETESDAVGDHHKEEP